MPSLSSTNPRASPRMTWWPVYGASCSSAPSDIWADRKSTRLNSSHLVISYAVFCLKKYLVGDELQEAQVRLVVGGRPLAREGERAQPSPGGGQRKPAKALDSIRSREFFQPRPAPIL